MPRTLFISMARGGSKGIPRKNLREVGGTPLIGRAAQLGRRCLERLGGQGGVVVSTDDREIADAARRFGADVPFMRPASLARDNTPSHPVVLHALKWLAEHGEAFDEVVLLQPTSPLTSEEDVLGCIRLFRKLKGPAVVAVKPSSEPVDLHFSMNGGRLERITGRRLQTMRQKRREEFVLAGNVYVASPRWLQEHEHWMIPGRTHGYPVPAERAVDVDAEFDLHVANRAHAAAMPWKPGRVLIIAEAGVNHNGDIRRALKMVDAAADAGADVVKFQIFQADECCVRLAPAAAYQKKNTGKKQDMRSLLRGLELKPADFTRLASRCRQRGVMFSASVFDEPSLKILATLRPPLVKIPSGEITNIPLIRAAARLGRPIVLSTGMSTMAEVGVAVAAIRGAGGDGLALLHCTSAYPCPPEGCNLKAMKTLGKAFGVAVGFSDHTVGSMAAVAAVGMGARILEKHFTLDKRLPGPDHVASADPRELAEYVRAIRHVERAMGSGIKEPSLLEMNTAEVARKSIVAARDLPAGRKLRPGDLVCKRPGTGLAPTMLPVVEGRRLRWALAKDSPVRLEDLA